MSKSKLLKKLINVEIEVKSKKWLQIKDIKKHIQLETIRSIESSPLKKYLAKGVKIELSINLCSNYQVKKINQKYRNINKATNVLSFANLDEKDIHKKSLEKVVGKAKYLFLGDIVFGYEYIQNEVKKTKKNYNNHLLHLIIHSILHLIGYDHKNIKMAKEMESLEVKILKKFGVSNPYIVNIM